jgi:hypothetical protein
VAFHLENLGGVDRRLFFDESSRIARLSQYCLSHEMTTFKDAFAA